MHHLLLQFLMEVTDKTKADVKGGTLINYDGHVRLLEIAQVPEAHVEDFKSVRKFKIFNTNNLWIDLKAVKRVMEGDGMDLEVIVNGKTSETGEAIIQLETAVRIAFPIFSSLNVDALISSVGPSDVTALLSMSLTLHDRTDSIPPTLYHRSEQRSSISKEHTESTFLDPVSSPSSHAPIFFSSQVIFTLSNMVDWS